MHSNIILLPLPGYALQAARLGDARQLLAYQLRNRDRLRAWEPSRAALEKQASGGLALSFLVRHMSDGAIVGECNFSNIIRGPFQACYIGFSIDAEEEGKGLMYAALDASVEYVFRRLKLHRVMANYRLGNTRSGSLLARLGFKKEGLARRYLKIDGAWTDHVLTAKINDAA